MRRVNGGLSLARATGDLDEDVSPPIPGNLADVMLVLAVFIMLALIKFWGVDIPTVAEVSSDKLQQIEMDLTQGQSESTLNGDQYQEMGTVYKDLTTGELYLLQN